MNNRTHWHQGLFVQPHHLQSMQRAVFDEAMKARRFMMPYSYGVCESKLSVDELANQRLRFEKLRVIMPSGLEVSFPENADLGSFDMKPLAESNDSTFVFYLAVPLYQERRANAFQVGVHADPREKLLFRPAEVKLFDENTGENPKDSFVQRINARLITDKDEHEDMEILPILRVVRSTGEQLGTLTPDPEYVPPSVYRESSHILQLLLQDLVNQLEVNRKEITTALVRTRFSAETARGIQYEQLFRLRSLLRYGSRMVPLLKVPQVTPLEWYLELRELHGDLSALIPDKIEDNMLDYDHGNIYGVFHQLDTRIRAMLRRSITANFSTALFTKTDSYFKTTLTKEQTSRPTEYFLAIRSAKDPQEVIDLVQDKDQFKFVPENLVNHAVRGIPLTVQHTPPLLLPAQTGMTYFKVERSEAPRTWQQITDLEAIAILWPEATGSDFEITLYMPMPED